MTEPLKSLDQVPKTMLIEDLQGGGWAQTLAKFSKGYLFAAGTGKWADRIEWLQEHSGTKINNGKGAVALRRMPANGVLELLTLFAHQTAVSSHTEATFGSLEEGCELADKVALGLVAITKASGPHLAISISAFNEFERIRKEHNVSGDADPETSTNDPKKILDAIQSIPSVKDQKNVIRYGQRKAAGKNGAED